MQERHLWCPLSFSWRRLFWRCIQNMYMALCLIYCQKPSFPILLIWLKTVERVMVVGVTTQLISMVASKILLQLLETPGISRYHIKLCIFSKRSKIIYILSFSYLRKPLSLLFSGCDKRRNHCGLGLQFPHYEITTSILRLKISPKTPKMSCKHG